MKSEQKGKLNGLLPTSLRKSIERKRSFNGKSYSLYLRAIMKCV